MIARTTMARPASNPAPTFVSLEGSDDRHAQARGVDQDSDDDHPSASMIVWLTASPMTRLARATEP